MALSSNKTNNSWMNGMMEGLNFNTEKASAQHDDTTEAKPEKETKAVVDEKNKVEQTGNGTEREKRKQGPVPMSKRLESAQNAGNTESAPVLRFSVDPYKLWTNGVRSERLSCSVTPRIRKLLDQEVMSLNIKSINDLINILLESYFEQKYHGEQ